MKRSSESKQKPMMILVCVLFVLLKLENALRKQKKNSKKQNNCLNFQAFLDFISLITRSKNRNDIRD